MESTSLNDTASARPVLSPNGGDFQEMGISLRAGASAESSIVDRVKRMERALTEEKHLPIGLRGFLADELPLLRKEIFKGRRGWRDRAEKRLGGVVRFCLEHEYNWERSQLLRDLASLADEWFSREET